MKLPERFLDKMESLLGEEFPSFLASYDKPRASGLRVQGNKINLPSLCTSLDVACNPIPWSENATYFEEEQTRPAKHPYYNAGLFYIQEPSAMLPAHYLHPKPGERVLDLCAAPGGKSLQLASFLGQDGILVTNDIHPARARVLLKNIERYGVQNAVVLNNRPSEIAAVFPNYFDKILIDAPCSGEGMFRKDPDMVRVWSPESVEKYATWQTDILHTVPSLLRSCGELVYSTCTFSREENELQIERFIKQNPDFEVVEMTRLWPHRVRGEGHFVCKLRRRGQLGNEHSKADNGPEYPARWKGDEGQSSRTVKSETNLSAQTRESIAAFSQLLWGTSTAWMKWMPNGGNVVERAGHVLWENTGLPPLKGLHVLRSGWLIGTVEKGRFKPSTAFALGLPTEAVEEALARCDLTTQREEDLYTAIRYLRGESIMVEGKSWGKGWYLVCLDGFVLGWAKGPGTWLKNEYPPGWRTVGQEES